MVDNKWTLKTICMFCILYNFSGGHYLLTPQNKPVRSCVIVIPTTSMLSVQQIWSRIRSDLLCLVLLGVTIEYKAYLCGPWGVKLKMF